MTSVTEIFHTASVREAARLQYWNNVANNVFGPIDIQSVSQRFTGRMRRDRFGGLQLARVESTPVAVQGLCGSGPRGIFLLVNQRGSCKVQQRGRQALLQTGELTAICAHEPYLLESGCEHVTYVLYVPGSELDQILDSHIAASHPVSECELLRAFIYRLGALGVKGTGAGNLLRTARDLIELNWPGTRRRPLRASATAWEQCLRQHVEQHLCDPDLSAERMAEALGISIRYVQMIFARMQTTASQYILERRLQVAAERLCLERAARIGDIALETGFNDLSYFCRRFCHRFGVSAREFRAGSVHLTPAY